MVIVTKTNFIEQSNDFLTHLPTAAFVAIDEEMTGISMPNSGRPSKDATPHQQYPELKKIPETYSIIQLGVTLFHYTGSTTATRTTTELPRSSSSSSTTAGNNSSSSGNSTQRPRQEQQQQQDHATNGTAASTPSNGNSTSDNAPAADWIVRRYNFFSFPGKDSDRSVVLNPSAVAFLHQHNISFDKWTKEGIPYQPQPQAEETLRHYLKKEITAAAEKKEAPAQPSLEEASRRRVQLRRTEDIDFFTRTMARLREWIDSARPRRNHEEDEDAPEEGASYLLPECNSFLRRALYENIQREFPGLILEKVPNSFRIRVLRLSDEENERRETRLRKEAWHNLIVEKVGLYRIFYALSQVARGFALDRDTPLMAPSVDGIDLDKELSLYRGARHRKIPIIVHNGFMDLCFMMSHFVSFWLPNTISECKEMIRKYFPVIFDTKILALEYSPTHCNENTRLGALFQRVKSQLEGKVHILQSNSTSLQEAKGNGDNLNNGTVQEEEHYADYDAYMTGVCYLGLCQSILRLSDEHESCSNTGGIVPKPYVGTLEHLLAPVYDREVRKRFGRNLLYQMSLYTLDLEERERDPLSRGMKAEFTIRVSNINTSVTTRDIVSSVSGLIDSRRRLVNFEIIWIDDTTFMVTSHRNQRNGTDRTEESAEEDDILEEHSKLIHDALQRKFEDSTITSWEEHLHAVESGRRPEADTISTIAKRLLSWIGIGSTPGQEGPLAKKRRLE